MNLGSWTWLDIMYLRSPHVFGKNCRCSLSSFSHWPLQPRTVAPILKFNCLNLAPSLVEASSMFEHVRFQNNPVKRGSERFMLGYVGLNDLCNATFAVSPNHHLPPFTGIIWTYTIYIYISTHACHSCPVSRNAEGGSGPIIRNVRN